MCQATLYKLEEGPFAVTRAYVLAGTCLGIVEGCLRLITGRGLAAKVLLQHAWGSGQKGRAGQLSKHSDVDAFPLGAADSTEPRRQSRALQEGGSWRRCLPDSQCARRGQPTAVDSTRPALQILAQRCYYGRPWASAKLGCMTRALKLLRCSDCLHMCMLKSSAQHHSSLYGFLLQSRPGSSASGICPWAAGQHTPSKPPCPLRA